MSNSDFPVGNVYLAYPESCGSNDMPGWIEFVIYDRKLTKSGAPIQTIGLYMPESAINPATVSWENESIGYGSRLRLDPVRHVINSGAGGDFMGGLTNLHSAFGKDTNTDFVKGVGLNMADKLTQMARNIGGSALTTASVVGSNISRNLPGTFASVVGITNSDGGRLSNSQATGLLTGKVFNPYLTAIFRGVDFRTFEFGFKFYPHNEKQCETIHNIIKAFRMAYLPKYSPAGALKDGILDYPLEFSIGYKWGTGDNKFVHKFKKSVLTSFDTNYTATGQWSSMKNSMPASISVSMRFSEVEIVTRDDVKGGY